jgi:hypothetical protein
MASPVDPMPAPDRRRLLPTGHGVSRRERDTLHGKARVSVQTTGTSHGRYVAESSPDPIGTWTSLPGTGKERKLSGFASGAKLWVHFAQVRDGLQSDWSAPVLVCFP